MSIELAETKLSREDLARWQIVSAKIRAIETTDGAMYSRDQIEEAYRQQFSIGEELLMKYSIDDSRSWVVSTYTGSIWYED